MKNKHFYLKLSILFALFFWFIDSVGHFFYTGNSEFEVIPSDFNELWMRSTILVLLLIFGAFADWHTKKIVHKEHEKYFIYDAMLNATDHILNNFLQKMIFFREEAEESNDFDKEILKLYNQAIDDTKTQINNLKGISKPSKEIIEDKFLPK